MGDKRTRDDETFATGKMARPRLDIARIYPILYPGAAVPDARQLVGGAGWPSPNCAACVKARPQTTEWLDFRKLEDQATRDPSLLGTNGRLKLRPDQGFTHNPAKCVHLHRHVEERVQATPGDAWMLTPMPGSA